MHSGRDRQRGGGERGRQLPGPYRPPVRPAAGEPVDVDRPRPDMGAPGDLRGAEVAAPRPRRAAPLGSTDSGPGRPGRPGSPANRPDRPDRPDRAAPAASPASRPPVVGPTAGRPSRPAARDAPGVEP